MLYLKDGTTYVVSDYWLTESKLHFVTDNGVENAIDVDQLDLQRTVDHNASHGVSFTLQPAPTEPPDRADFASTFAGWADRSAEQFSPQPAAACSAALIHSRQSQIRAALKGHRGATCKPFSPWTTFLYTHKHLTRASHARRNFFVILVLRR